MKDKKGVVSSENLINLAKVIIVLVLVYVIYKAIMAKYSSG